MKLELPDKIFGMDSHLLPVLLPTGGVIFLAIVATNLVIIPKIGEISETRAQTELVKQETKKVADKRDYVSSLNPEELTKNSAMINSSLLPEKNAYMLVNVIRRIADKYGFVVESFKISMGELSGGAGNTTKVEGVAKIPVNLTLTGSRDRYLELVNGMEKSLPVLLIERFEMKAVGNTVMLDLVVSAFYVEDKSKLVLEKLNLGDLVLRKEESDLIKKISEFSLVADTSEIEGQMGVKKDFVKYERSDPFNL